MPETESESATKVASAVTPAVTVILPTLNEESRLGRCLGSIRNQDYPQDRIRILVADGGSTDGTVEIAESLGAEVIDARNLLAEAAKEKALRLADGEYLAMVDADNTILDPQWLRRAIDGLESCPEALAFESYYAFDPSDPPLNRYLTGLMQISDPWARAVSRNPKLQATRPDGLQVFQLPSDGAYPTGANGFLFPRHFLDRLADDPFHEATFFPELIRGGARLLLKDPATRVHHDYVRGWRDFFRKKQRVAMHYLLRQEEVDGQWSHDLGPLRRWTAMLYCASFIGPGLESIVLALRDRRWEWLLHAPASALSVLATVSGILKSLRAGSRQHRQAASRNLKPRS